MATAPLSLMDRAKQLAGENKIVPVTQDFDESKGVEGRVNSITNKNSPLMQTAATRAAQASNARGLNSSSLGIQAGQQAVIETATPIANADANLYQQQSLTNQAAKNNAATANAGNAIGAGMQGMSLGENSRQFTANNALQTRQLDAQIDQFAKNLGLTTQELALKRDSLTASNQQELARLELQRNQLKQNADQFGKTQTQQMALANLDNSTRLKLGEMDAAWRKTASADQNLGNSWETMMQSIGNIQNNPNLDAAAKQTLIDNTMGAFKSYATFYSKTNNVDVSGLLKFGAAAPAPAPGKPGASAPVPPYQDIREQP